MSIIIDLFFLFAVFSGLVYLVFFCLREYRIDVFRHRLFNLRFNLFCCMQKNHWSFNNPHYRELESHINAMIFFAPQLSFARVILTVFFSLVSGKSMPEARYEDDLASDSQLPSDLGSELRRVHQKMIMLAGQHIYRTYPLTWPFLAGHFLIFFIKRLFACRWNIAKAFKFVSDDFKAPSSVRLGVWGTIFSDPRVVRKTMKQIEKQAVLADMENRSTRDRKPEVPQGAPA